MQGAFPRWSVTWFEGLRSVEEDGQAPRCLAQGKDVLHKQRKMNTLLPSNKAMLPALEDPALVLASFSPDL